MHRITLRLVALIAIAIMCAVPPGAATAEGAAQGEATQPAGNQEQAETADSGAPRLPAQVLNPDIDPAELELRLVPLTKGELEKVAATWLEIVRAKTEEVMEAQIAIARADGEAQQAARERLTGITAERKALFGKYSSVINSWEKKGGEEAAIADYRAYRNSIVVEETRTADFRTLLAQAGAWLLAEDGGIALAKTIAVVVVSLLVLLIVARLVRRLAGRWIGRVPNLSRLLQAFLIAVIYWLVLAFGLMIVLSGLGIDVTPLFALIAGASFILAFALQDSLSNLASGLMIMINRPFDEGDYVDVGGVAGTAKSVSIIATTVATPDNQLIVIPNKSVWGNVITNVTASATRRVDLVFGISYESSIAEAIRVMEQTVVAHPLVLSEPEPVIQLNELADSSVNFVCRPWVRTEDYWTVYWDLTRQMKERFDAAGISIPYPQRDLHIRTAAEPAGGATLMAADRSRAHHPASDDAVDTPQTAK